MRRLGNKKAGWYTGFPVWARTPLADVSLHDMAARLMAGIILPEFTVHKPVEIAGLATIEPSCSYGDGKRGINAVKKALLLAAVVRGRFGFRLMKRISERPGLLPEIPTVRNIEHG